MPLKPFTFDHNGQVINAQLMYNLTDISNTVVVILTDAIEGVNQTILFVYENNHWSTPSNLLNCTLLQQNKLLRA
jgi:hypothetical protein